METNPPHIQPTHIARILPLSSFTTAPTRYGEPSADTTEIEDASGWDNPAYALLDDGEKHAALVESARQKQFAINRRQYRERIAEPPQYPSFTAEQFGYDRLAHADRLARNGIIAPFRLDAHNEPVFRMLCQYFTDDEAFETENPGMGLKKGILLSGAVGCGKTTLMRIFALNQSQSYYLDSCVEVSMEFASDGYEDMLGYYTRMVPSPAMPESNPFGHRQFAFCFDDFGAEDATVHYGNRDYVMEKILFTRCNNRLPTHATTNLSAGEIAYKYRSKRLDSRLKEMFNLIMLPGGDRRK